MVSLDSIGSALVGTGSRAILLSARSRVLGIVGALLVSSMSKTQQSNQGHSHPSNIGVDKQNINANIHPVGVLWTGFGGSSLGMALEDPLLAGTIDSL